MSAKASHSEEFERGKSFISRELSWLGFARRVLALVARELGQELDVLVVPHALLTLPIVRT